MGIEGVNARIADIQSRIIALQTQQAAGRTVPPVVHHGDRPGGDDFASYLDRRRGALDVVDRARPTR